MNIAAMLDIDEMLMSESKYQVIELAYQQIVGIPLNYKAAILLGVEELRDMMYDNIVRAIKYKMPITVITDEYPDTYYEELTRHCIDNGINRKWLRFYDCYDIHNAFEIAKAENGMLLDYIS